MDPFRSWYQNPAPRRTYAHSPSFYGVPIYHVDPRRETGGSAQPVQVQHAESQKKAGQRGVVRIPVQFHGSSPDRRPESALMIQKVFRGYLVRKSLRKIREIKSQADEIEAKLLRSEVAEMIRRNERERLMMNESLMNLLFKLDGIPGVDLGVRVCRKRVTRKVILLQEMIDSIAAADSKVVDGRSIEIADQESQVSAPEADSTKMKLPAEIDSNGEAEDSTIEALESSVVGEKMDDSRTGAEDAESIEEIDQNLEVETDAGTNPAIYNKLAFEQERAEAFNEEENKNQAEDDTGEMVEASDSMKPSNDQEEMPGLSSVQNEEVMDNLDIEMDNLEMADHRQVEMDNLEMADHRQVEMDSLEMADHGQVEMDNLEIVSRVQSSNEETPATRRTPDDLDHDAGEGETEKKLLVGHNARDGVDKTIMADGTMLKKMMEDNADMMCMMARLYDRSEMQLQMLDALANRVNYLEKAYMCEKLKNKRRKNKKNRARGFIEE